MPGTHSAVLRPMCAAFLHCEWSGESLWKPLAAASEANGILWPAEIARFSQFVGAFEGFTEDHHDDARSRLSFEGKGKGRWRRACEARMVAGAANATRYVSRGPLRNAAFLFPAVLHA